MKLRTTATLMLAAACGFGYMVSASAQSCAAGPFQGTISTIGAVPAGNTCPGGVAHNGSFAAICSNLVSLNGAGLDIYQLNVGNAANFTITITGAFTTQLGMIAAPCTTNGTCLVNHSGQPFTTASLTPAAGTYFIFVGDSSNDNPGCGVYNLALAGTLPVKLENFSVQ